MTAVHKMSVALIEAAVCALAFMVFSVEYVSGWVQSADIDGWIQRANRYGFTLVFSVVMLGLMIGALTTAGKVILTAYRRVEQRCETMEDRHIDALTETLNLRNQLDAELLAELDGIKKQLSQNTDALRECPKR